MNLRKKLKITKLAWETKGVRSVKNAIEIKGQSNFKKYSRRYSYYFTTKTAIIFNKKIKSSNYTLETINKKTYIFGIAFDE